LWLVYVAATGCVVIFVVSIINVVVVVVVVVACHCHYSLRLGCWIDDSSSSSASSSSSMEIGGVRFDDNRFKAGFRPQGMSQHPHSMHPFDHIISTKEHEFPIRIFQKYLRIIVLVALLALGLRLKIFWNMTTRPIFDAVLPLGAGGWYKLSIQLACRRSSSVGGFCRRHR
jgi:hypothetical protein